jgi:hypothetical protein
MYSVAAHIDTDTDTATDTPLENDIAGSEHLFCSRDRI